MKKNRRPDGQKQKVNWKTLLLDLLICTIGSVLFAFSTHYFMAPHDIAPGGVTGIATLVNYAFHAPIGLVSFLINLPLLILGIIYLGHPFVLKSGYCILVYTFFIDVVFKKFPIFESENKLLVALFGGLIMGCGLGLIFMRNASTGGTDIGARLLQRKLPHISMGRLMMGIDALVVVSSAIVYNSIEAALYAIICIFVSSKVIDMILYGQDVSKEIMIITDHPEECADALMKELDRGLTLFDGEGGYTRQPKKVVMCVVRRNEFYSVKQIVKRVDPNAFMIISEVSEVLGEGFKENAV